MSENIEGVVDISGLKGILEVYAWPARKGDTMIS